MNKNLVNIDNVLTQNQGIVTQSELEQLTRAAWDKYRQRVQIDSVDWENQTVRVKLKESYHVADYAARYKDTAADIIADAIRDSGNTANFIHESKNDDFDLCSYLYEKDIDLYELTDSAKPEFIYTYELMRFLAENHNSIDLDSITQQGGDFINACRYECARAVADEVDDEDLLKAVVEKLSKKNK